MKAFVQFLSAMAAVCILSSCVSGRPAAPDGYGMPEDLGWEGIMRASGITALPRSAWRKAVTKESISPCHIIAWARVPLTTAEENDLLRDVFFDFWDSDDPPPIYWELLQVAEDGGLEVPDVTGRSFRHASIENKSGTSRRVYLLSIGPDRCYLDFVYVYFE